MSAHHPDCDGYRTTGAQVTVDRTHSKLLYVVACEDCEWRFPGSFGNERDAKSARDHHNTDNTHDDACYGQCLNWKDEGR